MADGFWSQANIKSSDIGLDVPPQDWQIVFPADHLSCLVNTKMTCKKIIMITTYYLEANDLWDIWVPLILEYSFDIFPVLRKVCRASKKFCFFVVFLQLEKSQSHTSNIGIKTFKSYFVLEKVLKLAQLGKISRSAYENLIEKWEMTWLACQKARYSSQWGLQAVQDFDILGAEGLFFFYTLLKVSRQDISSLVSLTLIIINLEVVTREFLGPANLTRAQTFRVYKPAEVVVLGEYEHLILRPL